MSQYHNFESLLSVPLAAQFIRKVDGKRYSRYPVRVLFNNPRACRTERVQITSVIASSPAEAANYIVAEIGDVPNVEITAYGPKGGATHRFIGYESAVYAAMMADHPERAQLGLF